MKKLYLVRHAKSSWDFPQLTDFDRPLNKRGKRDAPFMGELLKDMGISPDIIFASPAKRAFSTARLLAEKIGYPLNSIQTNMGLYHADLNYILQYISQQPGTFESIMLVGHNPEFSELAGLLSGTDIDNIPTSGIAGIEFDIESWAKIKDTKGKLLFFEYPKKQLKDLKKE
jgi:phosphohistidine phosphatase